MTANTTPSVAPEQLPSRQAADHAADEDMHAPDLYQHDAVAEPVRGLDAVDDDAVRFFHEHGYLAIENAFTEQEVADGLAGMMDLIMGRNPDFTELSFEKKAADRLSELTAEQRQDALRKLMHFVEYEPRLKAISDHPKFRDVLSRLMRGAEPKLFQDMGLIKPPKIGREKPWHQDTAYFNIPTDTPVVGAWIAFDPATIENGCMRVLDRAHQEGPIVHWKRRDWQICDAEVYKRHGKPYEVVAVPLKPGGMLLFDGMLPHGTPHNSSPQRRRAVQYHYYPANTREVPEEDRLAVFGSEGKDVEC